MNTGSPDRETIERRNNMRVIAIVGICLGVGLLVFGEPAGLLARFGPAPGMFWPLIAMACLVLGLIALTGGSNGRAQTEHEPTRDWRDDQTPHVSIEGKLRELMRLKEGKLISEDEYQRKRTEIIEKW